MTPLERLRNKTRVTDTCWWWEGSKNQNGYGNFGFVGKVWKAHRASYVLHNNTNIPSGMVVCHTCDNPSCVNPRHLFLGSIKDNITDRNTKQRTFAKITLDDAVNIRKSDKSQRVLAKKYNISQVEVWRIKNNMRWQNKTAISEEQRETTTADGS